ncbi:MAG: hypothetical protein CMD14_09360 [Flavobacteriales bacterium]|nr:hypothetical protein [Flavobacteriales bacterium]|tara:strand:- start:245 stop:550 length:306 start_codon:yes stop_codon:yes gene_type:complete
MESTIEDKNELSKIQNIEAKINDMNSAIYDMKEELTMINEYSDFDSMNEREANINNMVNNIINNYESRIIEFDNVKKKSDYIQYTLIFYILFSMIVFYIKL